MNPLEPKKIAVTMFVGRDGVEYRTREEAVASLKIGVLRERAMQTSAHRREEVRRLYNEGVSAADSARLLGVSPSLVSADLRRFRRELSGFRLPAVATDADLLTSALVGNIFAPAARAAVNLVRGDKATLRELHAFENRRAEASQGMRAAFRCIHHWVFEGLRDPVGPSDIFTPEEIAEIAKWHPDINA